MRKERKEAAKRLYEIAEGQQGFFTTKQAKAAGFAENTHPYHVQAGNWIREHRGIYRLASFPRGERPDLMLWSLWSRNRGEAAQGVYSHQTALSLHDLSDVMPAKLHMTVPKSFRRNSEIPRVLVLHFADLPQSDIGVAHGVRVTKPMRTILDLLEGGEVPLATLRQALREGLRRGLIRRSEIAEARKHFADRQATANLFSESSRLMEPKRYATAAAFRRALEDRLQDIAGKEGVDLQRLRRQVAFDRLLARLFQAAQPRALPWVLKGGYAMELRIKAARTTKDIDLTMRSVFNSGEKKDDKKNLAVLEKLQEAAAFSSDDFFVYTIGEPIADLDAAPYGGARFPVEARLDGRIFVGFHLDVGIGDAVMEPLEVIEGRDWLGFAGIASPSLYMIPREQQFAEKLHAYTLPRQGAANTRVRDLVDMVLLIQSGTLDRKTKSLKQSASLSSAARRTRCRTRFQRLPLNGRNRTRHSLASAVYQGN